jgi:hypothetical protein
MKKQTKTILWVIGIILVLGVLGFGLVHFGFLQQSIIASGATPQLQNGRVYWLNTLTANGIDEGLSFTEKPSKYTLSDGTGTTVTPQSTLTLYFSKDRSYCSYQMKEEKVIKLFGLITYKYYTLSSMERTALIKITDGNGVTKIVDGTIPSTTAFLDTDGKGEADVQTQGLLGGKLDCPEYSNVAIDFNKDGTPKFYSLSSYENYVEKKDWTSCGLQILPPSIISCVVNAVSASVPQSNSFTAQFSSQVSIDSLKTKLTGDRNIGTVVFTVTADQDYFDSVVYIPPKLAQPYVYDINIPSMKKDSTTSGYVITKNQNSNTGTITVQSTGTSCSVTPSSTTETLSSSVKTYLTIKAGSANVRVCPVSQLSSPTCDSDIKCASITESTPPVSCGNGVCDATENYNSCSTDCPYVPTCGDGICQTTETSVNCPGDCNGTVPTCQDKWGGLIIASPYTANTEKCTFNLLIICLHKEPVTTSGCAYDYTFIWIFALVIVIIVITIIVLTSKRGRKAYIRRSGAR